MGDTITNKHGEKKVAFQMIFYFISNVVTSDVDGYPQIDPLKSDMMLHVHV